MKALFSMDMWVDLVGQKNNKIKNKQYNIKVFPDARHGILYSFKPRIGANDRHSDSWGIYMSMGV